MNPVRWVAIDCETSGLDTARDRLLSVDALAVRGGRILLADSFEACVQQKTPSAAENILIHGIGGDEQRAGRPAAAVIAELSAYIGDGVPVGFHAPFDAAILRRHGLKLKAAWLDLAALLPVLFPQPGKAGTLDDWLGHFAIPPHARHDALGDAFATAQLLLLIILAEAQRQRMETVEDLFKAERAGRWLAPQGG